MAGRWRPNHQDTDRADQQDGRRARQRHVGFARQDELTIDVTMGTRMRSRPCPRFPAGARLTKSPRVIYLEFDSARRIPRRDRATGERQGNTLRGGKESPLREDLVHLS